MTALTPTPPCLGEREAVARTEECLAKTFEGLAEAADKKIWDVPECSDASEQEAFWFGYRDACRDAANRLRALPADAPLRTENETLRAALAQAKAQVAGRQKALAVARLEIMALAEVGTRMLGERGLKVDPAERTYGPILAWIDALTTTEPPHGD